MCNPASHLTGPGSKPRSAIQRCFVVFQFLQTNASMLPQIEPQRRPLSSSLIHHSLSTQIFDAV